jgi:hypothetical protein
MRGDSPSPQPSPRKHGEREKVTATGLPDTLPRQDSSRILLRHDLHCPLILRV